jgi:uncharacterized protein YdaU (DUF1376 family)
VAGPLPYFKFWQKDYLSSASLRRLSLAGHGLLLLLQLYQWEEGYLPDDDEALRRMVGADRREFGPAWKEVRSMFEADESCRLVYRPLAIQREETLGKVGRLTENGAKGGKPRGSSTLKAGDNPKVIESKSNLKGIPEPEPNTDIALSPLGVSTPGDAVPPGEKRVVFDREKFSAWFVGFRALYPQRKGNYGWPKAEAKLEALFRQGLSGKRVMDGLKRFKAHVEAEGKTGSPFVPMASTWVNAKGWDDEYPVVLRVESGGKPDPSRTITDAERERMMR